MTATSAIVGWQLQDVLDLAGGDVLGVADDDVLQPAGDGDVAGVGDDAEVAGAEVALLVERVGVERGVGVAQEELRAAEAQLAFLARARTRLPSRPTTRISTPGDGAALGRLDLLAACRRRWRWSRWGTR